MSPEDVEMLLGRISGFDGRKLDNPAQLTGWSKVLKDVPYAYAVQAVEKHFATSRDYLMPVHIRDLAWEIRQAEVRKASTETRAAAEGRSDEIRQAALERKAADLGTRVATPDEAERYGKGLMKAIMAAVAAVPRDRVGRIPPGAGVAAAEQALTVYQAKHGRAPVVDRIRQPCSNPHCQCTHEEPCEAGWMPVDPGDPMAAVTPCPMCKPRTATIVDNAKGNRREAFALIREQGKDKEGREDQW
jgi:hypothetical protein